MVFQMPTAHCQLPAVICYTHGQNGLKMQPCAPMLRTIRRRAAFSTTTVKSDLIFESALAGG